MPRFLISLALVAVLLSSPESAAAAGSAPVSTTSTTASADSGTPEVIVAVGGAGEEIANRRVGGRGRWTCRYFEFRGSLDRGLGVDTSRQLAITPAEGQIVAMRCTRADGTFALDTWFTWQPADPFGGIMAAESVAMEARALLPLPVPVIGTTPPADRLLTGFPTDLTDGMSARPLTATATLGAISATVTATPRDTVWDHGDGTTQTCPAGRVCTTTWTIRSTATPTGTYPLTAAVTWDITWTATNGQSGTLEPLTRATTVPVTVTEIQALVR